MDGSDKFLKENRTCATWSNAGADDGDEIPPSAGLHKFRRHLLRLVPLIQATYRASPGIPELRAAPAGRVNCSGSDLAPAAEPEAGFARQRSSHRVTAPAIRSTRYALTAWRPSVQTYLGAYRVGQRPDRAVRRRSPRRTLNLASPNNPATCGHGACRYSLQTRNSGRRRGVKRRKPTPPPKGCRTP